MDKLVRDPFSQDNLDGINDGKVKYSHVMQVKQNFEVSTVGETGTTQFNACLLPGISDTFSIYKVDDSAEVQDVNIIKNVRIVPQPVCLKSDNFFHLNTTNPCYWRLISAGLKLVNATADLAKSGWVENFEEPLTPELICKIRPFSLFPDRCLTYHSSGGLPFAVGYNVLSIHESDTQEFFLHTIDNNNSFQLINRVIGLIGNYTDDTSNTSDIFKPAIPLDHDQFKNFFDFKFKKQCFVFHLPPNQKITMSTVHNYEFFYTDSDKVDNLYLGNRYKDVAPLSNFHSTPKRNQTTPMTQLETPDETNTNDPFQDALNRTGVQDIDDAYMWGEKKKLAPITHGNQRPILDTMEDIAHDVKHPASTKPMQWLDDKFSHASQMEQSHGNVEDIDDDDAFMEIDDHQIPLNVGTTTEDMPDLDIPVVSPVTPASNVDTPDDSSHNVDPTSLNQPTLTSPPRNFRLRNKTKQPPRI